MPVELRVDIRVTGVTLVPPFTREICGRVEPKFELAALCKAKVLVACVGAAGNKGATGVEEPRLLGVAVAERPGTNGVLSSPVTILIWTCAVEASGPRGPNPLWAGRMEGSYALSKRGWRMLVWSVKNCAIAWVRLWSAAK